MTLKIKNFQAIAEADLDIVEGGLNVIVGPSDSGKSSVFRSLESLALNAQVDRRHGSKETLISWKGVDRVRGAKINEYRVDDLVFKAMRTDVPRQVQERLQLGEINFRPQHTPYFLLAESSGAVARSMNELADLGMIDHVTATLKSQTKSANSALGAQKKESLAKTQRVQALNWVMEANDELMFIEFHVQRALEQTEILGKIVPILDAVKSCDARLETIPKPCTKRLEELQTVLGDATEDRLVKILADLDEANLKLASISVPDPKTPHQLREKIFRLSHAEFKLGTALDELIPYLEVLAKCPPIEEHLLLLHGIAIPEEPTVLSDLVGAIQALPRPLVLPDWKLDLAAIYKAYDEAALYQAKGDELEGIVENTQNLSARYVGMDFEYTLAIRNFNEAMGDQCPLCGEPR